MNVDQKLEELWEKNERAARRLQRLADNLAKRAENRLKYGVGNAEFDEIVARQHAEALARVLELGDELEKAAIMAGYLPGKTE